MLEESVARQRILDSVENGPIIWVPLELALDQAIAQDLRALTDSPPFDTAKTDGYALRAAEAALGEVLRVAEGPDAANQAGPPLGRGEARQVLAGAVLPEGADAVVAIGDGEADASGLRIAAVVTPGEQVRRRASDVAAGHRMLRRGETVTPARIGLLASQGIPEVPVFARPLVQAVSTGRDLIGPGTPLLPGESYDSQGPMLHAAINRAGGVVAMEQADGPEALRDTLAGQLSVADFVVVAGSAADRGHRLVGEVLRSLGMEAEQWSIRLEPEIHLLFGRHPSGPIVLGLPANPVSALVAFTLFVAPAIRKRMGFDEGGVALRQIDGVAEEPLSNSSDRPHYLRAIHRDGAFVLSGAQEPHAICGLSRANCLIRLDAGTTLPRGAQVSAIEF